MSLGLKIICVISYVRPIYERKYTPKPNPIWSVITYKLEFYEDLFRVIALHYG